MTRGVDIRRFGDTALIVDLGDVEEAHSLGRAVSALAWRGVEDVIVGYGTVTIISDPLSADYDAQIDALERLAGLDSSAGARGAGGAGGAGSEDPKSLEIPVDFAGPDLEDVAVCAGTTEENVVAMLVESELQVAFVGFAPGFAYLRGLPEALAATPRRSTARTSVPAGSVALGGGFAGVYPHATPGGWHVVGRTDFALFDPARPPFAVLRPGDTVRFVEDRSRVSSAVAPVTRPRDPLRSLGARTVVVEQPGALSTVQDMGRIGVASIGVPRAGAADPYSLRIANKLVGNSESEAAIEVTLRGPRLRFDDKVHVAVIGDAEVLVDDITAPCDTVLPVEPGQTLDVRTVRSGVRAVIGVSGGIDLPPLFGSRSSDVLCHLGLGPLISGDRLPLGPATRPRGGLRHVAPQRHAGESVLRVLLGPDRLPHSVEKEFLQSTWEVSAQSDRVGMRLRCQSGPGAAPDPRRSSVLSRGMVTGAIQLPPDGGPIALLCDHATVGGFPVVASVASVDLGRLGQCRPGESVHLEPIDLGEAASERLSLERSLSQVARGWYPGAEV
ncbi:MAG TPA: urea amidolyase family protein [Acidimicrobiales bacterium]|nr:urea amidolyase family protein [Acidimicrobiales bacterium]